MPTIHWTLQCHGNDPEDLVGNRSSHMMVAYSAQTISIACIENAKEWSISYLNPGNHKNFSRFWGK